MRSLGDVFEIEARCWKQVSNTAMNSQDGVHRFYGTLAERCADRGWLRLYLLLLDGQPVAHIFGAVYGNTYYALKTSFDEAYQHLSPGAVLVAHAIRDAFAQGFSTVDLLGQPSRWKNEFATGMREQVDLCLVSANAFRCRLCQFHQHHLRPLVEERVKPLVRRTLPQVVALKNHLLSLGRVGTTRQDTLNSRDA
jgi:CelD/BcsL family acetyltransferase involved in cellulose biosynthesis